MREDGCGIGRAAISAESGFGRVGSEHHLRAWELQGSCVQLRYGTLARCLGTQARAAVWVIAQRGRATSPDHTLLEPPQGCRAAQSRVHYTQAPLGTAPARAPHARWCRALPSVAAGASTESVAAPQADTPCSACRWAGARARIGRQLAGGTSRLVAARLPSGSPRGPAVHAPACPPFLMPCTHPLLHPSCKPLRAGLKDAPASRGWPMRPLPGCTCAQHWPEAATLTHLKLRLMRRGAMSSSGPSRLSSERGSSVAGLSVAPLAGKGSGPCGGSPGSPGWACTSLPRCLGVPAACAVMLHSKGLHGQGRRSWLDSRCLRGSILPLAQGSCKPAYSSWFKCAGGPCCRAQAGVEHLFKSQSRLCSSKRSVQ